MFLLQNIGALPAQNGQVIPVSTHDSGLVFDFFGEAFLINQFAIGDHGMGKLNRRLVHEDDIHARRPHNGGNFVRQPGADRLSIHIYDDDDAKIVITHRSHDSRQARAEGVAKNDTRLRSQNLLDTIKY